MRSDDSHILRIKNAAGPHILSSTFLVCPNPDCRKFTLLAGLNVAILSPSSSSVELGASVDDWRLLPDSEARVFPEYIPAPIREDYVEACKIRDLSPKASATLSRRCLQGILRDFWKVKPDTLFKEIAEIEHKVDPLTWAAIHAVRKIGNIGAHMEKDANVIVDVEPKEAGLLISLIETVIDEWYVAHHERQAKMHALVALADAKG